MESIADYATLEEAEDPAEPIKTAEALLNERNPLPWVLLKKKLASLLRNGEVLVNKDYSLLRTHSDPP